MGQLQILGNISLGAELCIDVLSWHVIVYCAVVRRLSSPIEACRSPATVVTVVTLDATTHSYLTQMTCTGNNET